MEAPKIPSMFGMRLKKNNQFYFEPRYYNAKKEKMQLRHQRIEQELGKGNATRTSSEDFKAELKENWGNNYSRNVAGNQMNKRVIFYVLALLGIAYFILF